MRAPPTASFETHPLSAVIYSVVLIVISGNDIDFLCMFRTYVHCGFFGMSM